jgi:ATP-binding cassette subfamily B protein
MQGLEKLTEGRTTFVIAHRLSTVRRADAILVLDQGRIAEQGRFAELVARGGQFARLYETQFGEEANAASS